ncbi:hypothetical protein C8R44DRAFT_726371 [Mycena epipterygia]|nr:hypothetical protein C8R44DRAFT_726371 [Mycena epipterygia]
MNAYTLKALDAVEKPAPGSPSSLVFDIPFADDVPRQLSEYFHELVQSNKSTLQHVELMLSTGEIAIPLNLLAAVKDIAHLESFCVQWPLRGYRPLTLLLMSDWAHIIEDSITTSFTDFHAALIDVLSTHATTLKRCSSRPAGPSPHCSTSSSTTAWKSHQLTLTTTTTVRRWARTTITTRAGGGALLAHTRRVPRRAPAYRLDKGDLVEMLRESTGDSSVVKDLVVCTAWPIRYEASESRAGEPRNGDGEDVHAPGYGHLAYPPDQRPTTGLWPAQGAETRAIQIMAGCPWY